MKKWMWLSIWFALVAFLSNTTTQANVMDKDVEIRNCTPTGITVCFNNNCEQNEQAIRGNDSTDVEMDLSKKQIIHITDASGTKTNHEFGPFLYPILPNPTGLMELYWTGKHLTNDKKECPNH